MLYKSYKKVLAMMLALTFPLSNVMPAMAEDPKHPSGGLVKITDFIGGNGAGTIASESIYFGSYWQDGSGEYISGYSKSGIKWRVLANDSGKVLLLADKGLYADAFNNKNSSGNTWGTSEIRSTLNGLDTVSGSTRTASSADSPDAYSGLDDTDGFAKDAFNAQEYGAIAQTSITENNKTTQDKLFLLSGNNLGEGEVYKSAYGFTEQTGAYDSRVAPTTELAKNVEMYGNTRKATVEDTGGCYWYLRTPSSTKSSYAFLVDWDGKVAAASDAGVTYADRAVRPALNLN